MFRLLKQALRSLRKTPGISVLSVLVLAVGIGACTAMFSIVNAVLLKPLPYPDPARIFMIWGVPPAKMQLGYDEVPVAGRMFLEMNQRKQTLEAFAAFKSDQLNLVQHGSSERLDSIRASADFFKALGVQPALGRTFLPEDDRPDSAHVVVLSHNAWKNYFDSDPKILNQTISLNQEKYTVIGVMPPDFAFPRGAEMPVSFEFAKEPQLWIPLALPAQPRGPSDLALVARSKPGVSPLQVSAELGQRTRELEAEIPQGKGWFNFKLVPLSTQLVGDVRPKVLLLFGAVIAVLLMTCANVANLYLAKAVGRTKEIAIQAALGASRKHLVQQPAAESLVLSGIGCFLGFWLAWLILEGVQLLHLQHVARLETATLDPLALAFAILVALVSSLLFGIFPALETSAHPRLEYLSSRDAKASGGKVRSFRSYLLIAQVALSLALVITASLLLRSFSHLLKTDPGFSSQNLLTMEITLPPARFPSQDDMSAVYRRVLLRLQSVSGIESVGMAKPLPMSGSQEATVYYLNDRPKPQDSQYPVAAYTVANSDYFKAAAIPMLAGTSFTEADDQNAPKKMVVSRSFAQLYWKTPAEAVRHLVSLPDPRYRDMMIVGVVGDTKHFAMNEAPGPEMYVPYSQHPYPNISTMQFAIRTKSNVGDITNSIRAAVREVDQELPIANVRPMSVLIDDANATARFAATLLSAFALIALLLVSMGTYAIVSYMVAEREHEISIRIALGARYSDVLRLIFSREARMVGIGISLGLAAALAASRVLVHMVFEVGATDGWSYIGATLLLAAVAAIAIVIAAHRATRFDPINAIKAE